MSENQKDSTGKQKIFDAFVVTFAETPVYIGFPGNLDEQGTKDFEHLLNELPYLGRSESWISARLVTPDKPVDWNCALATTEGPDMADPLKTPLACLRPEPEYLALEQRPEVLIKKKEGRKTVTTATPLPWLEAIELSSGQLQTEGWSQPPAMILRDYSFARSLVQQRPRRLAGAPAVFCWAKYNLSGTVLPVVTEAISLADRVRKKLMGIHRKICGDDPRAVSPKFSGKGVDGMPAVGHRHAFFLPVDEDADGRLDHLYVAVKDPYDKDELKALDLCRSIWQAKGKPDVRLILSGLSADPPFRKEKVWVSMTPFVTTRHYRKGRGSFSEWLQGEITRECHNHGLPPVKKIDLLPRSLGQNSLHWIAFQRSRKGFAPESGYGFRLDFSEPVAGPFALGSGCHFGLGLFIPETYFPANR